MNLHEYQSKELFAAYELPVLRGELCYSPGEVEAAFDRFKSELVVIKAQVHAGGRGKAGGVKLAKSSSEARIVAEQMLGMSLVTKQTGKAGKLVHKVYVEEGCDIDKEFYLSFLIDRSSRCVSIVASSEGGMDIEEVAENQPEKIVNLQIDPKVGFQNFQGMQLGFKLGLNADIARKFCGIVSTLHEVFISHDLSMIEINPLVLTKQGEFVILDAKCSVDDNAVFRQPELAAFRDYDEEDQKDLRASKAGLSYISLEGNIGCMVNGAGLAMATMDIIQNFGGKPANFLDVGGGASKETVAEAFRILLSDNSVQAILVNIFGGIMKCDVIAEGVVAAAKEIGVNIPLIVRLQGTNVEKGRKILKDSGLALITADTMADAAQKVVSSLS